MEMDKYILQFRIDAILVMQEQEDTTTPALRSQLAETESSIGNILKAIEQGIFTPSTKQRLDELEARKEEILVNIQTAELQKPKLTREQMTAWFEQFRHGDPANREFQKRLIDTFVNSVYVFDDKLVLTYNYQHGTQTISLEEIESALSSDFDGATPPKNHRFHLKSSVFLYFSVCFVLGIFTLDNKWTTDLLNFFFSYCGKEEVMASIKEEGTRGKRLSYKIRVCLGRDENGRQVSKAMR